MSLNPMTADDPARVADYGALPGEVNWNSKQLANYERRIEMLEESYFIQARTGIIACINGKIDNVILLMRDGIRSASRYDLLDMLTEQLSLDESLLFWATPSHEAEQIRKRAIDALAGDVAKARAEIEAHFA